MKMKVSKSQSNGILQDAFAEKMYRKVRGAYLKTSMPSRP